MVPGCNCVIRSDRYHCIKCFLLITRVTSGNFGHQVNSDSDLVCFIF